MKLKLSLLITETVLSQNRQYLSCPTSYKNMQLILIIRANEPCAKHTAGQPALENQPWPSLL